VNQSQTGAIPHWLTGSGSSDSKTDSASFTRFHGTWCPPVPAPLPLPVLVPVLVLVPLPVPLPCGNSRAISRTTWGSAVRPGVMGKSNQQLTGEASVRVSRKPSHALSESLAEIRPSPCAPPLEIGSPS
jgi:hypothetical protein